MFIDNSPEDTPWHTVPMNAGTCDYCGAEAEAGGSLCDDCAAGCRSREGGSDA